MAIIFEVGGTNVLCDKIFKYVLNPLSSSGPGLYEKDLTLSTRKLGASVFLVSFTRSSCENTNPLYLPTSTGNIICDGFDNSVCVSSIVPFLLRINTEFGFFSCR